MAKAEAEALKAQAKDAESTASRKRLNQTTQAFVIAQRAIEKHRDISDIGHRRSMDQFMDANRELSNLMPAKVAELLDVASTIRKSTTRRNRFAKPPESFSLCAG
jgi:hypothetical protein